MVWKKIHGTNKKLGHTHNGVYSAYIDTPPSSTLYYTQKQWFFQVLFPDHNICYECQSSLQRDTKTIWAWLLKSLWNSLKRRFEIRTLFLSSSVSASVDPWSDKIPPIFIWAVLAKRNWKVLMIMASHKVEWSGRECAHQNQSSCKCHLSIPIYKFT